MTEIAAVVLAGGLARRMGGGDKALLPLGGRPLLAHVLARIGPQVGRIVLNANGDPARFAGFGLPVVPDPFPDHPGPLAGILAGLDWVAATLPGVTSMLSVTADAPFLPDDLVARLQAARAAANQPLACAASGGFTHPPIGLWPVSLRAALREALAAGERKIDRWTARYGCASAAWPDQPCDPFFNANTPEELQRAAALLSAAGGATIDNRDPS